MVALFKQVISLLGQRTSNGFCYACERYTTWIDREAHFTCTNCGKDPLHARPE